MTHAHSKHQVILTKHTSQKGLKTPSGISHNLFNSSKEHASSPTNDYDTLADYVNLDTYEPNDPTESLFYDADIAYEELAHLHQVEQDLQQETKITEEDDF